jgi:hypothetical protein
MLPIFEPSDVYSETLPISGSMRNGSVFEQPTQVHRTPDSASSSSRLLPTPEAKLGSSGPDYARASRPDSGGDDLATWAQRLPVA